MADYSTLETLIELASIQTDSAAQRLGNALNAGEQAEQKLALLRKYRDEYAAHFQAGTAAGLSAWGYRNFQQFLGKLDEAIATQQQAIEDARLRIAKERSAWQDSERRRKSYDLLANRAQQEQARSDMRRDQKSGDEQAARLAYYRR